MSAFYKIFRACALQIIIIAGLAVFCRKEGGAGSCTMHKQSETLSPVHVVTHILL